MLVVGKRRTLAIVLRTWATRLLSLVNDRFPLHPYILEILSPRVLREMRRTRVPHHLKCSVSEHTCKYKTLVTAPMIVLILSGFLLMAVDTWTIASTASTVSC